MRVLVVEDDRATASCVMQAFVDEGHEVKLAYSGLDGLRSARSNQFDLIVLDVMLPVMDGLQVCRHLRASDSNVPVLIITARDTVQDKIDGLESGADDYVVKPFDLRELLARSRAITRRTTESGTALKLDGLILDQTSQAVMRDGRGITLSRTEYALLEYLMLNAGQVVTRAMILKNVWNYDFEGRDNVLDVYINYLRRKIDKGFERPLIHTSRGRGYWIGLDDAP